MSTDTNPSSAPDPDGSAPPGGLRPKHSLAEWYCALGRVATVVLMIVIFFVALAPREVLPTVEGWNDKVEHFIAFGVLSIGISLYWRLSGWPVAAILTCYGVLIEVAQSFTPCRQASLFDVAADIAGIAMGLLLHALVRRASRSVLGTGALS
ncbi:VanZ family protein [Chlorobium sp. N1]|uniref:VanZ family protein n=1 Tax=Chlorobium sp. N1 TaxID=2491138 RepID=UPI001A947E47|nr:VanZ family protein [Chlorobium sp. N1]